ncbi:DUF4190 domain-containing protein [Kocuria turfanensis]|uniref:DUF4190 domain-containing protein n=1 Tax=Kocuria turfanensis TaxID=388357 RepID=A0A512IAL6_9MICC|nr:DUF4190 domain-containing protein [Kocuria turfanensis]GEO94734.1 hypothetical protein KTU01_08570 [Kocuria turfanensis]
MDHQQAGHARDDVPQAQPQYSQNPYMHQQYVQYPGYSPLPHPMAMQGMSHKSNAVVLGVIGLFVLGIVLGPLAISQASKAQSMGVPATAGKVLGWIDLAFGLLGLLWFLAVIGLY